MSDDMKNKITETVKKVSEVVEQNKDNEIVKQGMQAIKDKTGIDFKL